jgi:CheY-like chemotaxis protein
VIRQRIQIIAHTGDTRVPIFPCKSNIFRKISRRSRKDMIMDKATFSSHVRDALAHFYDPVSLQTSPLIALVSGEPQERATTVLREVLRNAIEELKPPDSVSFGRSEWTGYRILWERYIQRQGTYALCNDLGLGRSSFYRYQQQAIEAISEILWSKWQETSSGAQGGNSLNSTMSADERAVEEAVKLAETSERHPVMTAQLLDDVCAVIAPLANERGIIVAIDVPSDAPPLHGDPTILRQVFISILVAALEECPEGSLCLSVRVRRPEIVFRLVGAYGDDIVENLALGQRLLAVYGGRLWVEHKTASLRIAFALPIVEPPTILVADDDRETIALYQRYLQGHGYAVRLARNGSEIATSLAEKRPDAILLDVLMPQEDGWAVLQRLKTVPDTANIPVIVCSVLGQPSLALALGAAEVLRKPIEETELLGAIERALAPRIEA